jgi:hypothetical protein
MWKKILWRIDRSDKMEFWQTFSLVGIVSLLIAILSFRWGYIEGKLEIIEAMLEEAAEEERRRDI